MANNSSIICKALSFKARLDEDLVAEALFALQYASIKYFEEDRDINFTQFAVTLIRKKVIDFINKQNHTNGSDLHEKIHSAIKAVNAGHNSESVGYQKEIEEFGNCFGSDEFIEGTNAFMEKRKPNF